MTDGFDAGNQRPMGAAGLIGWLALLLSMIALAGPAAAQMADVTDLGFDLGAASAPIAIVEFGDFGCSACAHFGTETFPLFNREFVLTGRVKFKYVPFVMGSFPNSEAATKAALCAADQSSYWSMHDMLFERQRDWLRLRNPKDTFAEFASALRLDPAKFAACYDGDATKQRIDTANRAARELRVRGTPTFYIDGREALGSITIDTWRRLLADSAYDRPRLR